MGAQYERRSCRKKKERWYYRLLGKPQISPAPREFSAPTDFLHTSIRVLRGALAMPPRGWPSPSHSPRTALPLRTARPTSNSRVAKSYVRKTRNLKYQSEKRRRHRNE